MLRFGFEPFAERAVSGGIDSVLITDLPVEASADVKSKLGKLKTVSLLAPTSTSTRIAAVNRASDDFIYYVSTTGVTGARKELDPALLARLDEVRKKVTKPLAVGFGISGRARTDAPPDRCA